MHNGRNQYSLYFGGCRRYKTGIRPLVDRGAGTNQTTAPLMMHNRKIHSIIHCMPGWHSWAAVSFAGLLISFLAGCTAPARVALEPSESVLADVYTCKGLSEEGRWLDVTDEFDPEQDLRVIVVAQLSPGQQQGYILYELMDPLGYVAYVERRAYPKQAHLGIWWNCSDLVKKGGEGIWKATVYSDWNIVGQAQFRIGEPPVDEDIDQGRFMMITQENSDSDSLETLLSAQPGQNQTEPGVQTSPASEPGDSTDDISDVIQAADSLLVPATSPAIESDANGTVIPKIELPALPETFQKPVELPPIDPVESSSSTTP